ncbi:AAA family ATPase [Dysgonomonas gadei]|uniref:ATPase AAA-type core domain-containing protein n=1 Tax=Dysgonomonas gadei ATCC BAA-286 TaxID=742766 RepID=F5J2M1_9BACT|nr:ATP-binding protein [Dysgonomonas gadei]EGK00064.1 hypothetical protein HMPREF9455_03588 [Dysgonomonas gadei ATCC BAA-286]
MIHEFRVKNYLSFKNEQVLTFEPTSDSTLDDKYLININDNVKLLKIAYIYGANGSGKSNLLIALHLLRKIITKSPSDKDKKIGVLPFMLDEDSRNQDTLFSITFYIDQKKYFYTIQLNDSIISSEELMYYPTIRPARLFKRTYDIKSESSTIEFGAHIKLSKNDLLTIQGNTLNNSSVLATLTRINVSTSILNTVLEYFRKTICPKLDPNDDLEEYVIKEMDNSPDAKKFILELFREADFNISNLEIKKEDIEVTPEMRKFIEGAPLPEEDKKNILDNGKIEKSDLIFWHKTNNGIFNLNSEVQSDGTLRFLGMSMLLYRLVKQNTVITIDEIGASLHYHLTRYFISSFLNTGANMSQLIFTTHDINLLDEKFVRRDAVWFAEKNIDGETELARLTEKKLHKNVSIYNAYMKGSIGGVPSISN